MSRPCAASGAAVRSDAMAAASAVRAMPCMESPRFRRTTLPGLPGMTRTGETAVRTSRKSFDGHVSTRYIFVMGFKLFPIASTVAFARTASATSSGRCGCARRWGWSSWDGTRGCRRRCCPSSSEAACIRRCPPCCGLAWSSAWASTISSWRPGLPAASSGPRSLVFTERLDGRDIAWEFESLDFAVTDRRLNAYRVTFPAPAKRLRLHSHDDAEFVHVLSGRLVITIGGDPQTLDSGDSIYFDARAPHGYNRADGRSCAAIVVTTPADGRLLLLRPSEPDLGGRQRLPAATSSPRLGALPTSRPGRRDCPQHR